MRIEVKAHLKEGLVKSFQDAVRLKVDLWDRLAEIEYITGGPIDGLESAIDAYSASSDDMSKVTYADVVSFLEMI